MPKTDAETRIRNAIEATRWPTGPVCPRCGSSEAGTLAAHPGRYQCRKCRAQYRVTTGTALDGTQIALSLWVRAIKLVAEDSTITARDMAAALGVAVRTGWLARDRAERFLKTPLGKAVRDLPTPRRA
jgi:transposase-like protein